MPSPQTRALLGAWYTDSVKQAYRKLLAAQLYTGRSHGFAGLIIFPTITESTSKLGETSACFRFDHLQRRENSAPRLPTPVGEFGNLGRRTQEGRGQTRKNTWGTATSAKTDQTLGGHKEYFLEFCQCPLLSPCRKRGPDDKCADEVVFAMLTSLGRNCSQSRCQGPRILGHFFTSPEGFLTAAENQLYTSLRKAKAGRTRTTRREADLCTPS